MYLGGVMIQGLISALSVFEVQYPEKHDIYPVAPVKNIFLTMMGACGCARSEIEMDEGIVYKKDKEQEVFTVSRIALLLTQQLSD